VIIFACLNISLIKLLTVINRLCLGLPVNDIAMDTLSFCRVTSQSGRKVPTADAVADEMMLHTTHNTHNSKHHV